MAAGGAHTACPERLASRPGQRSHRLGITGQAGGVGVLGGLGRMDPHAGQGPEGGLVQAPAQRRRQVFVNSLPDQGVGELCPSLAAVA